MISFEYLEYSHKLTVFVRFLSQKKDFSCVSSTDTKLAVLEPKKHRFLRASVLLNMHTASQIEIHPLITKPYVNEVTLRGQKPPLKCC